MKFEDLEAWKNGRELVTEVYRIARETPLSREFGLRDQITRAAVSVMTNVAEGFERYGNAEKRHFYNIARASCGEVRSLLYVLADTKLITPDQALSMQNQTIKTGKLITGLIRSTEKRT